MHSGLYKDLIFLLLYNTYFFHAEPPATTRNEELNCVMVKRFH